jgi:hypothetical protein
LAAFDDGPNHLHRLGRALIFHGFSLVSAMRAWPMNRAKRVPTTRGRALAGNGDLPGGWVDIEASAANRGHPCLLGGGFVGRPSLGVLGEGLAEDTHDRRAHGRARTSRRNERTHA